MSATRVYVEPSGRRIEPFGDPPGEAPIGNRPLADWQAEAFREAGLEPVSELRPPCLVVPDTLFTTAGALRRFVDGAAGRDAVLVLRESVFGRGSVPVQPHVTPVEGGWRFEKVRFESGRGEAPVDVVVDPEEQVIKLPAPRYYVGTDEIEIGLARHPVITLHHWVHILWANQMVGGIELLSTPKWKWLARAAWAFLRCWSFNKWRLLGKLNRIGRGCDIHPTAIVEGSTLGDGVTVGPFARVLFSRLDDGVTVMSSAHVELSTLGARAIVSQGTVLRFCVLYPEAVAGQYLMQQCVLGRRAVTTGGAFSIDLNFEQPIRVPLDGELHSTGTQFLGSAFGHGCRIGTGFWMASGRAVPNGYFLIRDPDRVLSRLPPGLEGRGPIKVVGRTLEPVGGADAN